MRCCGRVSLNGVPGLRRTWSSGAQGGVWPRSVAHTCASHGRPPVFSAAYERAVLAQALTVVRLPLVPTWSALPPAPPPMDPRWCITPDALTWSADAPTAMRSVYLVNVSDRPLAFAVRAGAVCSSCAYVYPEPPSDGSGCGVGQTAVEGGGGVPVAVMPAALTVPPLHAHRLVLTPEAALAAPAILVLRHVDDASADTSVRTVALHPPMTTTAAPIPTAATAMPPPSPLAAAAVAVAPAQVVWRTGQTSRWVKVANRAGRPLSVAIALDGPGAAAFVVPSKVHAHAGCRVDAVLTTLREGVQPLALGASRFVAFCVRRAVGAGGGTGPAPLLRLAVTDPASGAGVAVPISMVLA
jgi:hypothetical protein